MTAHSLAKTQEINALITLIKQVDILTFHTAVSSSCKQNNSHLERPELLGLPRKFPLLSSRGYGIL